MTKIINYSPENPNGVSRDMTSEEEALHTQDKANAQTFKTAEDNAKTEKATAQASGNTKLLALGLTQAEATAMTGYTPPVAE